MKSKSTKLARSHKKRIVEIHEGDDLSTDVLSIEGQNFTARWMITKFERTSGEHSKDYDQKFSVRMHV